MHTPGPWVKDYGGTIGAVKAAINDGNRITPTVCTYKRYPHESHAPSISLEEAEANAHLIAASPDLLRMLGHLVSLAEHEIEDKGGQIVVDAKSVISKAKGE